MQGSISNEYVKGVIEKSKQFGALVEVSLRNSRADKKGRSTQWIVVRTKSQGIERAEGGNKQESKLPVPKLKPKISLGATSINFALDYLRLNLPNLVIAVSSSILILSSL